jgi:hypothetical protein
MMSLLYRASQIYTIKIAPSIVNHLALMID